VQQVSDDWKFLSKVVDRILLYVYITVCFVGGAAVMMSAPSLYDTSKPITKAAGGSGGGGGQPNVDVSSDSGDCPCPVCP